MSVDDAATLITENAPWLLQSKMTTLNFGYSQDISPRILQNIIYRILKSERHNSIDYEKTMRVCTLSNKLRKLTETLSLPISLKEYIDDIDSCK